MPKRRRCGFDTRPPHHGAPGQRAKRAVPCGTTPFLQCVGKAEQTLDGPDRRAHGADPAAMALDDCWLVPSRPHQTRGNGFLLPVAPGSTLGGCTPPRGITPTLPLPHHILSGRAALWRTAYWYDPGALRGPILWRRADTEGERSEPRTRTAPKGLPQDEARDLKGGGPTNKEAPAHALRRGPNQKGQWTFLLYQGEQEKSNEWEDGQWNRENARNASAGWY